MVRRGAVAVPVLADVLPHTCRRRRRRKIREHAHFQQGQQQGAGASLSRAISYCVYMLRSVSIIISVALPSLVEEQDAGRIRENVVLDETVERHSSCTTAASASSRRKW
jgi:hypothetical protein